MHSIVSAVLSLLIATNAFAQSGMVIGDEISGAKVGAITALSLGSSRGYALRESRPSPMLGIFASLYLSQGQFLSAGSALLGIDAQRSILAGFTNIEDSETYALLKEFSAILQTDIVDMLNRSENRAEALETYVSSLENIMTLAERKVIELEALEDEQREERREKKSVRDDIDRLIDRSIREDDYETAGANQEPLAAAEQEYAEIDTKFRQTQRVLDTYEELVEVAVERQEAIAANREIIIAGLKVVDVPGIEDLMILED